jgi:hypothetical protein
LNDLKSSTYEKTLSINYREKERSENLGSSGIGSGIFFARRSDLNFKKLSLQEITQE